MGGEWRGREEGSKKNKGVKVNAGPPRRRGGGGGGGEHGKLCQGHRAQEKGRKGGEGEGKKKRTTTRHSAFERSFF